MAQGFFKSLCREEFYEYKEHKVQSISNKLQSFLQNLPRYVEEEDTTTQFTTNDPELEASHRFNSPTRDEYDRQRRHIFANQLFGPDQPQSQYLNFIDSLARISLKREGILIVQWQHSHFTLPPNGNISD